jgi:hypothetical protein
MVIKNVGIGMLRLGSPMLIDGSSKEKDQLGSVQSEAMLRLYVD